MSAVQVMEHSNGEALQKEEIPSDRTMVRSTTEVDRPKHRIYDRWVSIIIFSLFILASSLMVVNDWFWKGSVARDNELPFILVIRK